MKCKSAGLECRAAAVSLRERVRKLGWKRLGKLTLGDAVIIRQLADRHIEGAEQHIEHREGRGKIPLAAALRRGVVPAVEHRAGDDVFERPKLPVKIGVHEGGMS